MVKRVELDAALLRPRNLQDRRRTVAVKAEVRIGEVVTDHDIAFEGEGDESLHEGEVDARARRVVRKRDDDHPRLDLRPFPSGEQSLEEVVAGVVLAHPWVVHRHGDDGRAREAGARQVDRIARGRHDRGVPRAEHHPHEVRETLLCADGRDHLGLGVEVNIKEQLVAVRDRKTEVRYAPARAVAVVLRVVGGLGELLDRDVGARQVGVPEAEVDDVAPVGARVSLQAVDLSEDVRGQARDAAELHL